jgi:hypothetical protein
MQDNNTRGLKTKLLRLEERFDNYVSLLHSIHVLERSIVKDILFLTSTTSVLGFRSRKVFMAMIGAGEMVH